MRAELQHLEYQTGLFVIVRKVTTPGSYQQRGKESINSPEPFCLSMSHTETFVWSWGAGTRGQLANGAFADSLKPVLLANLDGSAATTPPAWNGVLKDMGCGGAHAVAILSSWEDGEERAEVVSWGNGESGALGHGGSEDVSVPKVVECFNGIRVCSVAAGWSHTAFVTLSGALYTCGSGSFGQLGHGDFEERLIPCRVESFSSKSVVMAACGMRHTLVLTHGQGKQGETSVFSFGASRRGQLGLLRLDTVEKDHPSCRKVVKVSIPQEIAQLNGRSHDEVVEQVAANGNHSAAITNYGHLFIWGRGFCGESDYYEPKQVRHQRVPSLHSYKSHFCGWNHFTDVSLGWDHVVALTVDGVLWAWGSNQRMQLGSIEGEASEPVSTSSESCVQEGGFCDESDVSKSTDLQWPRMVRVHGLVGKCVMCSAGSEHSAALCDKGELRVWGWGEHGQLGLGNTSDVPLPQVVSLPGNIKKEGLSWRSHVWKLGRKACKHGYTLSALRQRRKLLTSSGFKSHN